MTVLLTIGTYDTPHAGHAVFLRRCERFADRVVVGIRSDEMVRRLRHHPPVFSYDERARLIRNLGYDVHESVEQGRELIDTIRPDVLAIGSDWGPERRDWLTRIGIDQDLLDDRDIVLTFVPYTSGISTTILKRRLGGTNFRQATEVPTAPSGVSASPDGSR